MNQISGEQRQNVHPTAPDTGNIEASECSKHNDRTPIKVSNGVLNFGYP
jgi:hypothetical protein